jgi:ribonuclease P protein component
MKILPNGLSISRFGLSVSKRVGNAVTRNRTKRRLREILRRARLVPGWDIVIIARPSITTVAYDNLQRTIDNLLYKAELVNTAEITG